MSDGFSLKQFLSSLPRYENKMRKQLKKLSLDSLKALVPYLGIFCFAGCSTHALSEFFQEMARTPSRWYDVASWLVEGFSAYIITRLIVQVRIATATVGGKYGVSGQDQRLARWALVPGYLILAAITIVVSVIANTREFGGNVWLGSLFPSLCVACAIAAGLDDIARAKRKEWRARASNHPSNRSQGRSKSFLLSANCAVGSGKTGPMKSKPMQRCGPLSVRSMYIGVKGKDETRQGGDLQDVQSR